ncbi:di-trans,poly-cis-decaprenylcistransferase [Candidatus Micrarchaeota archaeon]|nr:di-trans,poly-cis-decaprenylcistransferase [Candidatus Micrarchaeota archaeon]
MKLKSIAIIPDGNRRFAMRNALSVQNAYASGFTKVEDVVNWANENSIDNVTFWALSLENFKGRSKLELRILFALMRNKIRQVLRDKTFVKKKTHVKFFGKIDLLPKDLVGMISELEAQTEKFEKTLEIAIAYSGREEIMNAAKRIAVDFSGKEKGINSLTEKDFEKYLYSKNSPDLIIRTGGVSRLSGFMPWQNAYSELYFSRKLWPEFGKEDFEDAIKFYNETERRFGK